MANPGYEIKQDNRNEYRVTFYAGNSEAIFVSSEGYTNLADAQNAIALIQKSTDATVTVAEREVKVRRTKKPRR